MWQRFSAEARKAIFYAQEEALRQGMNYVGPEHLLLGIVRDDTAPAAVILSQLGKPGAVIRAAIVRTLPTGDDYDAKNLTLTPLAKRAIDAAYDAARSLGDRYIGSEHILVGLIKDEGLAGKVLAVLNVTAAAVTNQIRQGGPDRQPTSPRSAPPAEQIEADATLLWIQAKDEAARMGSNFPTGAHLLLALLKDEGIAGRILAEAGLDYESVKARIQNEGN